MTSTPSVVVEGADNFAHEKEEEKEKGRTGQGVADDDEVGGGMCGGRRREDGRSNGRCGFGK